MNIEALCAAPPEALTQSTSQMPLSCPIAPEVDRAAGPQRLRPCRHAPDTSPGCRSRASAPSPAAARQRELRTSPGCRPRRAPRPRPRRHADTRRTPRRAADRGPPCPRPPPRAEENFARRRATTTLSQQPEFRANSRRANASGSQPPIHLSRATGPQNHPTCHACHIFYLASTRARF